MGYAPPVEKLENREKMKKIITRVRAFATQLAGYFNGARESEEFWRGHDWGVILARDNETDCWAARMETRHVTGGHITDFERGAMCAIGRPLQTLHPQADSITAPRNTAPRQGTTSQDSGGSSRPPLNVSTTNPDR